MLDGDIMNLEEKYKDKTRAFRAIKELIPYIVIVIVVVVIRTFIMTPVRVNGSSMSPYLEEGDILLLNKLDSSYERFDIVVVDVNNTKIIKRVIGLPGETVAYKDCQLYINDKPIDDFVKDCTTLDFSLENLYDYLIIPDGYYFVLGDNRENSSDSRDKRIGLIHESQIKGTVSTRLYPFGKFGKLK